MNETRLFLGIDGGGSRTRALVIDASGTAVGRGEAGPSNPSHAGWDGLAHAIRESVATSGLKGPFAGVHAGIAGVASDESRARVCATVVELGIGVPGSVSAGHDLEIALAGGLSGRPGIVLVAGTGSACFGRNAAGDTWQAGGWGHILDDAGGGYWLGLRAIMAAVRADDGREAPTELKDAVLKCTGAGTLREVLARLQDGRLDRAAAAALAPLVVSAAQRRDASAVTIVALGASELATMAGAVAGKIGRSEAAVEIVLAGGVCADPVYGAAVELAVRKNIPGARFTRPELSPVAGAAILAAIRSGAGDLSAPMRAAGL